jgi:very-short-patch-repair endonuclease
MRSEIDDVLARFGGAASRAVLLSVVTRNQLDDEVARGHLVTPFARAYCRPWDADHRPVLERAAIASVGEPVALSHLTALWRYELLDDARERIHVTVPDGRHPIGRQPRLTVHRTRVPTRIRTVGGLPTVEPATALVRSWPLMPGPDQRVPAIEAVRRRLVRPEQLLAAGDAAVGMRGRAAFLRLARLLESGCESELELWGYLEVFDIPGLRHGVRQLVVQVRGRRYRLDLGYEEERVAVELDGYRFHSGRLRRERDMQRDTALASIDWITLRFSHERLHEDVAGCRRDTLAVLAARRSGRGAWRRSG